METRLLSLRHTEEGRKCLQTYLAARYVKRGAQYLQRHAPHGWFRNCVDVRGGRPRSRIRMRYSGESVLCIAFEHVQECADVQFGYVEEFAVLKHLGLELEKRFLRKHALYYDPLSKPTILNIPPDILDAAWKLFLLYRIPD